MHAVWDNPNTHRAQAVWHAFNVRHGKRFHFHFTPLHASWVNQIELWFARYTRRVLRHASHTSTVHLRERTAQFIREHNQAARPFKWSFRGYPLQSGASYRGTDMPALPTGHYAAELQRQLRGLLGHEQIGTQAYGRHLLIKRLDDEDPTVVARLTELGRNRYGAAFRSHSGRWEPLPGAGSLDEMAQLVVTLLEPYLQPDN